MTRPCFVARGAAQDGARTERSMMLSMSSSARTFKVSISRAHASGAHAHTHTARVSSVMRSNVDSWMTVSEWQRTGCTGSRACSVTTADDERRPSQRFVRMVCVCCRPNMAMHADDDCAWCVNGKCECEAHVRTRNCLWGGDNTRTTRTPGGRPPAHRPRHFRISSEK